MPVQVWHSTANTCSSLQGGVKPCWPPTQGQGNGAFVESVQKAIATELDVGIADMTNQEKKQLIKQYSKRKH